MVEDREAMDCTRSQDASVRELALPPAGPPPGHGGVQDEEGRLGAPLLGVPADLPEASAISWNVSYAK